MDIEDIKQQKLVFTYNGNYDLSFVDEAANSHKEPETYTTACVDVYNLVQSCFEPSDNEIFTCGCGWPECAGIYNFSSWLTETEIFWHVNDDYFRFDRKQYIEEVKSKIVLMSDIDEPEWDKTDYFGSDLTKKRLLELKEALDHYDEISSKVFPRHKVILCPDENKIYTNETGKRFGFKNKDYLQFKGKFFLGQDYLSEHSMPELKNWASQIRNKETIDWSKWNEEGIDFAKEIRGMLPSFFDVWYRFQGEDKEDLHILEQEEEENENN